MTHRRIAIALVVACGCTSSLSWTSSGLGGSTPATSTSSTSSGDASPADRVDQAAAWKKLTLKGIALGTGFFEVPGFTCGPDPSLRGFSTYRRTCVKFLDERCAGRPTKINHVSSHSDMPAGQICFMDEGNGGTYLDGKFMSPPLSAIAIVATDTSAPRVYEIRYTFARDMLTTDSKLGQALLAKYGKPSHFDPPTQMSWTAADAQLDASCGGSEGPQGDYCTLTVSDTTLLDSERSKQKAADEQLAKRNAPAAPTF